MIKRGFTEKTLPHIISDQIDRKKWAICVGAGTSKPIFPLWYEIVDELIESVNPSISSLSSQQLKDDYRPDTLIQATLNRLKLSNHEYVTLLSEKLFSRIRKELSLTEWHSFRKCLAAKSPCEISETNLAEFMDIVEQKKYSSSAYQIAKLIVKTLATKYEPSAILSFNAESLLYAIINVLAYKKGIKYQCLDFINLSISAQNKHRIPYIFCHGTLPIPDCKKCQNKKFENNNKLVFLENEYLQLANNSFSWQANSFLEIINSCTVIFIGVSLTDPNMRRWLSWTHATRLDEIKLMNHADFIDSTKHYWINKVPSDPSLKSWIEASVSHLGIRLIWIDDWDRLGPVLNKLVNIH